MILLFFTEKGEEVRRHDFDINMLRSMEYCSPVAGIVASFLIYQLASGVRRLPMILAALLAGFCASGQAATLSRSDWIALSGCILSIFFLLPRERRMMRSIRFALVLPTLLVFLLGAVYAAARVTHTDFAQRIQQRIDSMLPTERQTSKEVKAWDSRLGSTIREIELWAHSPLLGNGFGHRYIYSENGEPMPGYGHNSWSFTLYQTGPLGLAAMVVVCVGSWI